jgi:hypothetical protein
VDESGIFPCRYLPVMVLHAYISPGGWTITPMTAAVQRRSLTASTWTITTMLLWLFYMFIICHITMRMMKLFLFKNLCVTQLLWNICNMTYFHWKYIYPKSCEQKRDVTVIGEKAVGSIYIWIMNQFGLFSPNFACSTNWALTECHY